MYSSVYVWDIVQYTMEEGRGGGRDEEKKIRFREKELKEIDGIVKWLSLYDRTQEDIFSTLHFYVFYSFLYFSSF